MKTRDAILLTAALFIIGALLRFQIADTPVPLLAFIILGTSIWATLDSAQIRQAHCSQRILQHPVVMFLALVVLWVIAFPWYLSLRRSTRIAIAD